MIASWILYALAISILITVAGIAIERALVARGRPTRFVWAVALALSIAWPLGPTIGRMLSMPRRAVSVLPFTIVVQAPSVADESAAADSAVLIDRSLIALWVAASALLLFRLARGVSTLQRARAAWRRGRVNGVRVQLSDNVGPAVVGLRSMDVVLPEWILSLDAPLRALVLQHEEEHRSARDPYLLFGAAIAVAMMPWNAALWFQARRLRLAIEMDCDARVLRVHPSPERYGMLILTIAQRRSTAPALFAPMLSEPTTNLERRILAMRTTTRKVARTTVYGGGLVAVAVLAFASSLQSAGTSLPKPTIPRDIAQAASFVAPGLSEIPVTDAAVAKMASIPKKPDIQRGDSPRAVALVQQQGNPAPRYPDVLRSAKVEGTVVVTFMTNAEGAVDSSSIDVVSSTHDLFKNAVLKVLPLWRLRPNSAIQTPFVFVHQARSSTRDIESLAHSLPGAVVVTAASGAIEVGAGPIPVNDKQTFFEFQVEKQSTPMPGNSPPRYPDVLRHANVEGEVLAQFVVGVDGMPDMSTFKELKSTHPLFTGAVMAALPNMRFNPADVGGQAVKQLIQMPFQFSLSKQP